MIKIENAQLNAIIKCLDFNNQMRVNSKYIEILSHIGEENKEKAERLISAYIFHCLMNNDFLIETLISSKFFLNKISIMTNEQVETYIKLCLNAKLGILITSKTLLKEYNVEDHLRICELHIAYFENPVLAEIIEVAAKHRVKFLYIKKIAEMVCNLERQDKYVTSLLLKEEFYSIKSDFERLIILEHIFKTDNEYEKHLYRYLASNIIFTKNNDIYYLIGLVGSLIRLEDETLSDELIMEINATPSITKIYSFKDFYFIMNIIKVAPMVKEYFFHPFILANFNARDIYIIYNLYISRNSEDIEQLINKLERDKREKKDIIFELQNANIPTQKTNVPRLQDMADISSSSKREDEISTLPVSLAYKISKDGEWIDA